MDVNPSTTLQSQISWDRQYESSIHSALNQAYITEEAVQQKKQIEN